MCSVGFTGVAVRANQSKLQVLHVFCYAPKSELTFQFCLPVFQDWSVWGGAGAGRCDGSALPSVAADHREQGLAFWSGRWRSVQKHSPLLGASDKGLPR